MSQSLINGRVKGHLHWKQTSFFTLRWVSFRNLESIADVSNQGRCKLWSSTILIRRDRRQTRSFAAEQHSRRNKFCLSAIEASLSRSLVVIALLRCCRLWTCIDSYQPWWRKQEEEAKCFSPVDLTLVYNEASDTINSLINISQASICWASPCKVLSESDALPWLPFPFCPLPIDIWLWFALSRISKNIRTRSPNKWKRAVLLQWIVAELLGRTSFYFCFDFHLIRDFAFNSTKTFSFHFLLRKASKTVLTFRRANNIYAIRYAGESLSTAKASEFHSTFGWPPSVTW